MGHGDGSTRRSHSAATKSVNERPPMNTDPCSSVLLTCKSLSGGQGYFHREDAKNGKKSDFKNFASSRWISLVVAGLLRVHRWFHFVQFTQTKIPLRETTTDRSARSVVL